MYLLDDPLSAVDAKVGRHLYERCLRGHLLGGDDGGRRRTVVLVTHQVRYLRDADRIAVLNAGRLEATGNYKQLVQEGRVDLKGILEDEEESKEMDKDIIDKRFQFKMPTCFHFYPT